MKRQIIWHTNEVRVAISCCVLLLMLISLPGCGGHKLSKKPPESIPVAITHVMVVDVTNGEIKSNQTVLIENGVIRAVGPSDEVSVPPSSRIVEATGKYLIPGLWDMHVHLSLAGEEVLPLFLAYGITGVRNMGTNSFDSLMMWKKEIENGSRIGPHIVATGPMIDGPFFTKQLRKTVTTEAEARAAVDSLAALGVDFIKVHQMLGKKPYMAVIAQAQKYNLPVVGHKPHPVSTQEIIEAGQKSIEHIFDAPDSAAGLFPYMLQKGTHITPTLVIIEKIGQSNNKVKNIDHRDRHLTPLLKVVWEDQVKAWGENPEKTVEMMKTILPRMLNRTAELQRNGVPLLAGTDFGVIYIYPGSSLHEELELLVRAGLSPLQALQSATIIPARFLNKAETFGSIEAGKMADLLLLNANPLENISNTQKIHSVVFKGRVFDFKMLQTLKK